MNTLTIPPIAIHPGEFLSELLDELNITQAQLARITHLSTMRISHIVRGERPITADIALRFGRVFGQSPQYWLNLQDSYDLAQTQPLLSEELASMPVFA